MKCPQCSTPCIAGARFCRHCGVRLSVDSKTCCLHCGGHLESGSKYCIYCRTRADGAGTEAVGTRRSLEDSGIHRLVPKEYTERLLATGGRVRSERREISVLFMDMVGSTRLVETVDPEDALEIMNGAFEALVEPVKQYEGTVARLMGDGILCFFGAPTAHEDDAERACRTALGMQQAAARYADRLNTERGISDFRIRIGISTGMVVVGQVGASERVEYTAMGDAVNLGARLEALAQPGGILISEPTQALVRHALHTEDAGEVSIRGRSRRARAFRLVRSRETIPVRRPTTGMAPMVGRAPELQQMQGVLAALRGRQGGILTVTGEAGIGKSRLILEAKRCCPDHVDWIHGQCTSASTGRAYGIARDVFRPLLGLSADASEAVTLGAIRAEVNVLWDTAPAPSDSPSVAADRVVMTSASLGRMLDLSLPAPQEELIRSLTRDELQNRIRDAFIEFVGRKARRQPVVLVWEDIHWIDPSSLSLLRGILPLASEAPLAIVLVSRTHAGELDDLFRLAAQGANEACNQVELQPLARSDSACLATNILQSASLPAAVMEQVLERTGGNAFFLEEVLRGFLESADTADAEPSTHGTHLAAPEVPRNLQRAIVARLDRLNPRDKYVLQTASVLGARFSAGVVTSMLSEELGPHAVESSLERLTERGFLQQLPAESGTAAVDGCETPVVEVRFRHVLISEVAYNTLLRSQRSSLHRAAGEALETTAAERISLRAPELAHHFEQGDVPPKAFDYLLMSAQSALRLQACHEARNYFRRALADTLQLQGTRLDPDRRAEAYEGLGDVEYTMGEYGEAVEHFERARTIVSGTASEIRLLRKLGQVCEKWGRYEQAQSYFTSGLEGDHDGQHRLERARIYSGLCRVRYHQGEAGAARELGQRALDMMSALDDARSVAEAHNSLGIVCMRERQHEEARAHLAQSLATWEHLGDRYGLATCHNNLGLLAREADRLGEARSHYLRSLVQFRHLRNRHGMARVFDNLSDVYLARGDLERASRYVGRAVVILAEIGVDQSGVLPEMWQSGAW